MPAETQARKKPAPPPVRKKKEESGPSDGEMKMTKKVGKYSIKELLGTTPPGRLVKNLWGKLDWIEDPWGELQKEIKIKVADAVFLNTLGVKFKENPAYFLYQLSQNAPKTLFNFFWEGVAQGGFIKWIGYEKETLAVSKLGTPVGAKEGFLSAQNNLGDPTKTVTGVEQRWVKRKSFKPFWRKRPLEGPFWDKVIAFGQDAHAILTPIDWLNGNSLKHLGWETETTLYKDKVLYNGVPLRTGFKSQFFTDRPRNIPFLSPLARNLSVLHSAMTFNTEDLQKLAFQKTPLAGSEHFAFSWKFDNLGPIPVPKRVLMKKEFANYTPSSFFTNAKIGKLNLRVISHEGLAQILYYVHPLNIIRGWDIAEKVGWETKKAVSFYPTTPRKISLTGRWEEWATFSRFYPAAVRGRFQQFNRVLHYIHPRNWINGETFRLLGWARNLKGLSARKSANALENLVQSVSRIIYQLHPASWGKGDYSIFIKKIIPYLRPRWVNFTTKNRVGKWLKEGYDKNQVLFKKIATAFASSSIGKWFAKTALGKFLANPVVSRVLGFGFNIFNWVTSPVSQVADVIVRRIILPAIKTVIRFVRYVAGGTVRFIVHAFRVGPRVAFRNSLNLLRFDIADRIRIIRQWFQNAWRLIRSIPGRLRAIWQALQGVISVIRSSAFGSALQGAWASFTSWAGTTVASATGGVSISGVVGGIFTAITGAVGTVATTVGGAIGSIAGAVSLPVIVIGALVILIIVMVVILVFVFIIFVFMLVTFKATPGDEVGIDVAIHETVIIDGKETNIIETADGKSHLVEFYIKVSNLSAKQATNFEIHYTELSGAQKTVIAPSDFKLNAGAKNVEIPETSASTKTRHAGYIVADTAKMITKTIWGKATVDGKRITFSNVTMILVNPSALPETPPCGSPTSGKITALFGDIITNGPEPTHTGIDIASNLPLWKQDVYSPMDGIISASYTGPFGGLLSIKSLKGTYQVDFVHLNNKLTNVGQRVRRGDWVADTVIGILPGYSSGTHLHYRTKKSGAIVDPMSGEFSINRRAKNASINVANDCGINWKP